MERDVFVTGLWWISADDCGERVKASRLALGSAFGWTDEGWFGSEANLGTLYDFLAYEPGLVKDVDEALNDDLREQWLDRVAALKSPTPPTAESPSTTGATPEVSEGTDGGAPVGEIATGDGQSEPPKRKPLFGSKPKDNAPALPSIKDLPAGMQKLLAGALEKDSVDEAVGKIYDNLHNGLGLQYRGVSGGDPGALLAGSKQIGMCETFRNAFLKAVEKYDSLRRQHPVEAVRTAPLAWEPVDTYAATRFCTRRGLSLIGSGLKGNVSMEVDGKGALTARGYDSCNRFVFGHHWTATVNGKLYDPIFYSHDDNVDLQLDNEYKGDGGRFVVAMQKTPGGEFQGSWIWISDWAAFSTTVGKMVGLYTKYKKEIDKILAGDLSVQEGLLEKTDRKSYREAKAIVTNDISNADIFLKVVTEGRGNNEFAESDATAVKKIIDLAFTK